MAGESHDAVGDQTDERTTAHGSANGHSHAKTYILIGLILTIVTAVEVAIFYIPQLESVLVPVLLTLSAAKFVLVVLFYMHLRDDDRLFSRVFFGPLCLALLVVISLVILFKYVPIFDRF